MSANNVVWVMEYDNSWYVWYSSCYDNMPVVPDKKAFGWRFYKDRKNALVYAHNLVKYIEEEWTLEFGLPSFVEYGVIEIEA